MPGLCFSGLRRITAMLVSAMMLAAILCSAVYIATETGHDCSGEDCPICACLQICDNILNRIGGGTALQEPGALQAVRFVLLVPLPVCYAIRDTLILQKVRMNN